MPSARMSQLCATANTAGVDLHAFNSRIKQSQTCPDMSTNMLLQAVSSSAVSPNKFHFSVNDSNRRGFEVNAAYLSPHALYAADLQYNQGQVESPEGHRASQQNSHPAAQSVVALRTLSALSQPQVHWSLQHASCQQGLLAADT